jgi:Uncharacterized membrane protein
VQALSRNPKLWVDFMMRYELGLEEPDPKRARNSAATIAMSYIAGGFIPLAPYMIFHTAHMALMVSVAVTLVALAVFGYIKGHYTGARPAQLGADDLSGWISRRSSLRDREADLVTKSTTPQICTDLTIQEISVDL